MVHLPDNIEQKIAIYSLEVVVNQSFVFIKLYQMDWKLYNSKSLLFFNCFFKEREKTDLMSRMLRQSL